MSSPSSEPPAIPSIASAHGQKVALGLQQSQKTICTHLQALEPTKVFQKDPWKREEGGGGLSCVLEAGSVWEKSAVLYSAIRGEKLPKIAIQTADTPEDTPFFACGLSLIIHPCNPYVPAVHFNVRYFEAGEVFWYGGGMDVTPFYPFLEDCQHIHQTLANCCNLYGKDYYHRFKEWCDRYFYLPHRGETRGIGGIFFNHLADSREQGWDFIAALSEAFLAAYLPTATKRIPTAYGEKERAFQCYRRGRYVEFNLLYDQGTLFGLQSGGRVESILASMPPQVRWIYNWQAEPNSPEAALQDYLRPREWI